MVVVAKSPAVEHDECASHTGVVGRRGIDGWLWAEPRTEQIDTCV